MQNPLGWEVGMAREAGRDYWLQFGVFFLQMNFFGVVFVFLFFCQKHFLKGYLGNRVSNGFP